MMPDQELSQQNRANIVTARESVRRAGTTMWTSLG